VKSVQAQLDTARLNLERNVVRAPADGFVANMQITEGTMTTTVMSSSQGSFVVTGNTIVSLVLPQNLLTNVGVGDVVEIAFKSLPGEVATGKVESLVEYTGEGQVPMGQILPQAAAIGSKGKLVVRVELDDAELAADLPVGGAGAATIYTKSFGPFHLISKVVIRMKTWLHYLPI